MLRLLLPFFMISSVAATSGLSGLMSEICAVAILCGYLDWVDQGRSRFTFRGPGR